MTEQTFIKGKDSDLETSIATMQAKLKSFGFDIEVNLCIIPTNAGLTWIVMKCPKA